MATHLQVLIIGAGPAGLAAAANAAHHKLSHLLIEKAEIGNTIHGYQLGKHVMAEPGRLPKVSPVPFEAGTREEILGRWSETLTQHNVRWEAGEVTSITRTGDHFTVKLKDRTLTAKNVVLAIGVQGSPRKLGVPGDDLPHVSPTLRDPAEFQGRDILVVGAGDAAIENALALCENNTVSLLNRTADFPRAKEANASKIMDAITKGKIRGIFNAEVRQVEPNQVLIQTPEGELSLPCNYLIARLGCILPRGFLEKCGVTFPSKSSEAVPIVNERYESAVPGLFLLGALIGYPLIKQCLNQGHEVIEHILGNPVAPADQPLVDEALAPLGGDPKAGLRRIQETLPLFHELSQAQLRELVIESKIHRLSEGQAAFQRNDYTDTFWSVIEGQVGVATPEGKIVHRIDAGGFFGELGLLSGRRRSATVVATQQAILLESPRKQILKLNNSLTSVQRTLDQTFVLRALQSSVFPDADPAFLKELSTRATLQKFSKGAVIFREGDVGDSCYVIRKGSVRITRRNERGVDVPQTYLAAGNLFGEMALLEEPVGQRSATVSAAVGCELIAISREDLHALLEKSPATRTKLKELAQTRRLQNMSETTEHKGRVLDFMLTEGVTDADNILIIDSDACIACDNCEKACAATHDGHSRLDRKGGKNFARIQIPVSCRHCENPLCMLDCPPDALTRRPNGEVIIRDCCIGCGNCVRNCPYGVIQLVYEDAPESFSLLGLLGLGSKQKKAKGPAKAAKCDLCETLPGGPACVRSCPTGAAIRMNPSLLVQLLADCGRPR